MFEAICGLAQPRTTLLRGAIRACWFVIAAASLVPLAAHAQATFGSKPFTILVPGQPGGAPDVLARGVAQELTRQSGQQVIVENRAGASGKIAAQALLRAPRDGSTLLSVTPAIMSVIPLADRSAGYDPIADLQPIIYAARSPVVVVAAPSAPVKTLAEAVPFARRQPGRLSYASAGNTTSTNLAFAQLIAQLDIAVTHVPYSGEGPAIQSVLGGQVDWMIGSGVLKPQIDAGRLAPVATTGATRWAMLPSVPTVRESGLPEVANYAYALWLGVVTIAGVPSETITKLHEAIATALRAPDLRGTLERQGYEIVAGTPQEFAAQIRAELDQNRKLIEGGRIKLD